MALNEIDSIAIVPCGDMYTALDPALDRARQELVRLLDRMTGDVEGTITTASCIRVARSPLSRRLPSL
jgi:hypothetical protein